jgi:hypothetical protein
LHAIPAASGRSCETGGQKGAAAPRRDPDSVGSAAGTSPAAAVWAPKAVRCTGGLFFHRDLRLDTSPAGETAPASSGGRVGGSGEGASDNCSSATSTFAGADSAPCFSGGGDWMDDVRALASFLESDEEWVVRCEMGRWPRSCCRHSKYYVYSTIATYTELYTDNTYASFLQKKYTHYICMYTYRCACDRATCGHGAVVCCKRNIHCILLKCNILYNWDPNIRVDYARTGYIFINYITHHFV